MLDSASPAELSPSLPSVNPKDIVLEDLLTQVISKARDNKLMLEEESQKQGYQSRHIDPLEKFNQEINQAGQNIKVIDFLVEDKWKDMRLKTDFNIITSITDELQKKVNEYNHYEVAHKYKLELNKLHQERGIDPLTHLANRRGAMLWLAVQNFEPNQNIAILFIDLDDFKNINETKDHKTGDECLSIVARQMNQKFRPGDAKIRYSGDEFVIIAPNGTDEAAEEFLTSITTRFNRLNQAISAETKAQHQSELTLSGSLVVFKETDFANLQFLSQEFANMNRPNVDSLTQIQSRVQGTNQETNNDEVTKINQAIDQLIQAITSDVPKDQNRNMENYSTILEDTFQFLFNCMLKKAEISLKQAKKSGKNQLIIQNPTTPSPTPASPPYPTTRLVPA